jgi:hypothetical protein
MSRPKPQYVANILLEYGHNLDFKNLKDIVFAFFKAKGFSMSEEEISD